ncbi:MAG: polysaccharide pyruvyl transferase family protein [Acutalibacteraceae bacterium]
MKKKSRKVKILLVQITNKNYGDNVIADCTRYLIKKAFSENKNADCEIYDYSFSSDDPYQVKYVDYVVFDGGAFLKFKIDVYYHRLAEIVKEAQKWGVPVFFNAIGVEEYDENDERCLELKSAINMPCVKAITVRDDFETLKANYITNKNIRLKKVTDPAVWVSTISAEKKQINPYLKENCGFVGLGIARDKLFTDHDIPSVDREYLLTMWRNTALGLEKRGYKWKIFTNGLDGDEEFAQDVLDFIGHGEKCPQPKDGADLVQLISSFKGIIATRMHSNIIAYSFGVPSVGMVWNIKVKIWGQKIGYPERFLSIDDLSAENLVKAYEKAQKSGCRKVKRSQKYKTYNELKRFFLKRYEPVSLRSETMNFKKYMIAVGLGSMQFKYKASNSVDAFKNSVKCGYKSFEADVRFTSDKKLVCINGWTDINYNKLGLPAGDFSKDGIPYDKFIKCKYFDQFSTMDFDTLLSEIKKLPEEKRDVLIVDIGKPNDEMKEELFKAVFNALENSGLPDDMFIIRLQRKRDIVALRELGCKYELMYSLPVIGNELLADEEYKKTVAYCRKQKINMLYVTVDVYNREFAQLLRDNSIKACVFGCTRVEDVVNSVKYGARYVGGYYYGPGYINKLAKQ